MRHIEGGDSIVKSRLNDLPGRLAQLAAIESDPERIRIMLEHEFEGALAQLNKDWKERG